MRILFVSSQAQMAGVGGGVTYTRGILSLLERIDGVEVRRLVLPLPWRRAPRAARRARALARSLASSAPSKAHYLIGRRARAAFRGALAARPADLVVLNSADLLPLAAALPPETRCALVSHNVESRIIAGQVADLRVPGWLRRMLERDVAKTRRMEEEGARRLGTVIAVSEEDARWYRRLSPDMRVIVAAGTFGYPPYGGPRPAPARPLPVGYLAKLSWWPNRQGADWFANTVLPALPAGMVEAHFFGPGTEAYDGRHPALRGHGFVASLDAVWRTSAFTLCPIFGGSGINIKLVESLYNRVPVLATPQACRGLPPIDDPALAVVPPEEWPAFLASDCALALAATQVRPETAARFSAAEGARRLAAFLRSADGAARAAS